MLDIPHGVQTLSKLPCADVLKAIAQQLTVVQATKVGSVEAHDHPGTTAGCAPARRISTAKYLASEFEM
jgi:hypothetical protein